jgi:hypothetical protein
MLLTAVAAGISGGDPRGQLVPLTYNGMGRSVMARFQHGQALLIGIGDYQDEGLKLPALITAADARGLADALRDPKVGAYPDSQVRLPRDAETTRDGVLAALEQFTTEVKTEDTAFIFFCGHGVLDEEGTYTFTTRDTRLTPGKKAVKGTGVSAPQFLGLLRKVKASKLLCILNACFSGHVSATLAPPDVVGAPPAATLGVEVLSTGAGRVVLTASRPSQFSFYNKDQPYTYFGRALIDGLRGQGVVGAGGYVGLYELYQHVYDTVKATASGAQEPVLNVVQGIGPFPVALYPGASSGSLAPNALLQAPPPGTAFEALDHDVVNAIGHRSQAYSVKAGGNVVIDSMIHIGPGSTIGSLIAGDMAKGDIIKVTLTTSLPAIAAVDDRQQLVDMIEKLRSDVERLQDADEDERRDATTDLDEAAKACQKGNRSRLLEKLGAAEKGLLGLRGSPGALKAAELAGALLQQALVLKDRPAR